MIRTWYVLPAAAVFVIYGCGDDSRRNFRDASGGSSSGALGAGGARGGSSGATSGGKAGAGGSLAGTGGGAAAGHAGEGWSDAGEAGRSALGGADSGGAGGNVGGVAGGVAQGGAAGRPGACQPSDQRSCVEAGLQGPCASGTQVCDAQGEWGACSILPQAKDTCETGNDANCNGTPNEGCTCKVGASRPCANALGNCATGTQKCASDGSGWSVCDIQPQAKDSCTPGDDANCNGKPNEGCSCVTGQTQPCGPSMTVGICHPGTSTCTNGAWGACVGAVTAQARDCTSSADNDCDGKPDKTIDTVCQCAVGTSQACNTHTQDGTGICKAGSQTCAAQQSGSASAWGACSGSVGPKARDCSSTLDNNCDGKADNLIDSTCQCKIGNSQTCGTHTQDGIGICKAGSQTCVAQQSGAASAWDTCTGSVGPKARDCSSTLDNNCDGVADNTIDGTCKCKIGSTQACDTHPQDGIGICKAGSQTCVAQQSGAASAFSTCAGGVAPKARDCGTSLDNDCDGLTDNGTGGPAFVKVPEGYCIDNTEVTRSQYQAWLNTNPTKNGQPTWCGWNTDYKPDATCMATSYVCQSNCNNHPQVCIDWCDAYAYCKAVGKRLCGGIGGGGIPLTSENSISSDQWYNVCTSHGVNTYPYGTSINISACNHYPVPTSNSTVPVAGMSTCQSSVTGYKAVYDLSGNVQEWEDACANLNDDADCAIRGGWFMDEDRSQGLPCGSPRTTPRTTRDYGTGFRCCSI